ncbi:hypothetical protein L596_002996 [Steinernema carpocapsae]|uniref:Uncharacterized protein n=1 Tax=Steinernema carpocapsae TaxID=34508 RepID=A0A4U8UTZ7_STECR|nr:hypothetical protein L596_002996 [Steinernema carpocapsae]
MKPCMTRRISSFGRRGAQRREVPATLRGSNKATNKFTVLTSVSNKTVRCDHMVVSSPDICETREQFDFENKSSFGKCEKTQH